MDVDEAEEVEGVVVAVVATWEEDGEDTWEGEEEEDAGEAEGGINRGIGVMATVVEITTTTEISRGVDQHLDRIIGGRKQLRRQRRTKACLKNSLDLGGGIVLVGMAGEMFFVLHCQSLMVNHLQLEISKSLNS
jgi:hypothetical protein